MNVKPTISIVVSYAHPYIGSGIGNVAQAQAELLALDGYTVNLISSNYPTSAMEFTRKNVKHIKFPAWYVLEKIHVPVPLTLFSQKVFKALFRSTVIHVHDGLYVSSFIASLFAKLFRKKLFVTAHITHVAYDNPIINSIEKIANFLVAKPVFFLADIIFLINDEHTPFFSKYGKKVRILPNGVDTKLFKPVNSQTKDLLRRKHGIPLKRSIALFVGRLVPKKGFDVLIKSKTAGFDIILVGGGTLPVAYRSQGIRHVEAVEQKTLAEFYQLADVLVLPSHGEGYPLCIKEALACGLRVITTFKHPSLKSLLNNMVFHVPANPASLRKIINHVTQLKSVDTKNDKLRQYVEEYSWKNNLKSLVKFYDLSR